MPTQIIFRKNSTRKIQAILLRKNQLINQVLIDLPGKLACVRSNLPGKLTQRYCKDFELILPEN